MLHGFCAVQVMRKKLIRSRGLNFLVVQVIKEC